MKLEEQIVSLELSKHLKELGVKQESYFAYHVDAIAGQQLIRVVEESRLAQQYGDFVSAFTVAELGEMLPPYTTTVRQTRKGWVCKRAAGDYENANTEANARAKMLIYLLENNLLLDNK